LVYNNHSPSMPGFKNDSFCGGNSFGCTQLLSDHLSVWAGSITFFLGYIVSCILTKINKIINKHRKI